MIGRAEEQATLGLWLRLALTGTELSKTIQQMLLGQILARHNVRVRHKACCEMSTAARQGKM